MLHRSTINNKLYKQFQSGFHPLHGTATTLIKVTNDLLLAADSGFLTIYHLPHHPRPSSLHWNHQRIPHLVHILPLWSHAHSLKFVQLKNVQSQPSPVTSGVLQGSVLGPLLFIINLLRLGFICRKHNIHFHRWHQANLSTTKPTSMFHPSYLSVGPLLSLWGP